MEKDTIIKGIAYKYPNKAVLRDNGDGVVYIDKDQWKEEVGGELPTDEASAKEYIRNRQKEYNQEGATIENLVVALWEKVVENRDEMANEIQTKREAIKSKYPKG